MIDLRSDTVTKPTPAMRKAMAHADVGDDERDGDPTVLLLEAKIAELLGKGAALFCPSGVMANAVGVSLFAQRGTEVFLDYDAHIVHSEGAGVAALCGAQVRPVYPKGLVMDAEDLRNAFREDSRYVPQPSLVCVENTHNGAGGKITDLRELRAIQRVASEHGLPVHMDGARLWNASVATGISPAEFAECADTVMVDLSKGLGAPVGAAVAGTHEQMERAWLARKMYGGAMRQAGIIAAGALYGLEHHMDRLEQDHENAKVLAKRLDGVGGARVVPPDTNIVMLDLAASQSVPDVARRAKEQGVRVSEWSPTRIRLVTHLDVSADQAKQAGEILARILA